VETLDDKIHHSEFLERLRMHVSERFPNRRKYVPPYFFCKACGRHEFNPQALIRCVCLDCGGRKWKAAKLQTNDFKVERSHLNILNLLLESYTRKQIAQKMKFSEATISILIRDLAESDCMVELWDYCHDLRYYGEAKEPKEPLPQVSEAQSLDWKLQLRLLRQDSSGQSVEPHPFKEEVLSAMVENPDMVLLQNLKNSLSRKNRDQKNVHSKVFKMIKDTKTRLQIAESLGVAESFVTSVVDQLCETGLVRISPRVLEDQVVFDYSCDYTKK